MVEIENGYLVKDNFSEIIINVNDDNDTDSDSDNKWNFVHTNSLGI